MTSGQYLGNLNSITYSLQNHLRVSEKFFLLILPSLKTANLKNKLLYKVLWFVLPLHLFT